jgi:NAD(P)-dependent dehydrogenase (short-subunit alcohol dehydrogenase family)
MPPLRPRGTVLVTGASTGIGDAVARHLDSLGLQVVAGVRREQDAEAVRQRGSGRILPVHLDVADADSIAAAMATLDEITRGEGLVGLVNNAGISSGEPLEYASLEGFRRTLEVNLVGAVAVTQAALPMIRRGGGRLVFIGSIGGRMPVPFTAAYAASKAGVAAVCDCLRGELRPWGIRVSLVEPGAVATPIWEKGISSSMARAAELPPDAATLYGRAIEVVGKVAREAAERAIPPERVARAVEHALTAPRPRTRYLVGVEARAQALVRRLPDRARDRLVAAYMKLPGPD